MQTRALLIGLTGLAFSARIGASQSPSRQSESTAAKIPTLNLEQQIAAAVLPLPAALRAGAGVIGFPDIGASYKTLRKSTNGFQYVAMYGGGSTFEGWCINGGMFPAYARAFDLDARKTPNATVDATIDAEVKSGKLALPTTPVVSYLMRGPASAYDPKRGTVGPEVRSWQTVAAPHQTGAALGLPEAPVSHSQMPYVMQSGSWQAHIMVVEQ